MIIINIQSLDMIDFVKTPIHHPVNFTIWQNREMSWRPKNIFSYKYTKIYIQLEIIFAEIECYLHFSSFALVLFCYFLF